MPRDLLLSRTADLDSRDAGLASEIVFGVLRYRAQLDFLIAHYAGPPAQTRSRSAHRPPHGHLPDPLPGARPAPRRRQGKRRTREARAQDLRRGLRQRRAPPGGSRPRSSGRIPRSRATPARSGCSPAGSATTARPPPSPSRRPPCSEPEKYVRIGTAGDRTQDIGSQSIVPLLRLESGQSFLDLCAAPGNKTAQALEAGVHAVACDLHFHRLAQLKPLTPEPRRPRWHAPPAVRAQVRPHPGGRALLRHRHPGPQSRDQVAAHAGGSRRPACPPVRAARQCARPARARRTAGLLHLLAGARRERDVVATSPVQRRSTSCSVFPDATPGTVSTPL